ncbi:KH domain-containing protein [Candidatus Woesearchaeota archaeon]|nr:KH domain-containing protein [Candidatus Woesearchaeota archaeon]
MDEIQFSYELKVPKDRIAVLIGKNGEVRRKIEEETNSKIHVDSKEGDVHITGDDSLGLFSAREIIKAIGRGFSPEIALLILKSDYAFELLNISDYVGKSDNTARRLKARVIGTEGKTRRYIETTTETHLSVYGKTIAIIGEVEKVMIARRAVESILAGATHASVYKWLEKKIKELERNRMLGGNRIELKEGIDE